MSLRNAHYEQYFTLLMLFVFFEKLSMAKKIIEDEDLECEGDDFDAIEITEVISPIKLDARRRLEKIIEDKELERLIDGEYDDFFSSY